MYLLQVVIFFSTSWVMVLLANTEGIQHREHRVSCETRASLECRDKMKTEFSRHERNILDRSLRALNFSNANFERAEEFANANAKRLDDVAKANAQRVEHVINVNGERTRQTIKENEAILKQILLILGANQKTNPEQNNNNAQVRVQCNNTLVFVPSNETSELREDCADYYAAGFRQNGVYRIFPWGMDKDFKVYCDMETDEGGWTVFQRRGDYGNSPDYFFRTWNAFKNGFGDLSKEFWLGNDRVNIMTKAKDYELRIDIWDEEGEHRYAKYIPFELENEEQRYSLTVGGYTGTAGDSMTPGDSGKPFSTRDRDNVHLPTSFWGYQRYSNPLKGNKGAWWYGETSRNNLNGLNLGPGERSSERLRWDSWGQDHRLTHVEMKIRPDSFIL